jgi:8-oxo-dGTP pyrophosphatase MutT (NUDIX family)
VSTFKPDPGELRSVSEPPSVSADNSHQASRGLIKAAGGVIVRDGRVLLVHRARQDDWSFPKGKLEAGETWEAAALREVEEETALACTLGDEIGRTHYVVEEKPKEVRYFHMSAAATARAQNEVDDLRWLPLDEARELLTYEHDRHLLDHVG